MYQVLPISTNLFIGLLVVNVVILSFVEFMRELLYRVYAFWRNTLCCVWCIDCWNVRVEKKLQIKKDRDLAREMKAERDREKAEQEALEMGKGITVVTNDDLAKQNQNQPMENSGNPYANDIQPIRINRVAEEEQGLSFNKRYDYIHENEMNVPTIELEQSRSRESSGFKHRGNGGSRLLRKFQGPQKSMITSSNDLSMGPKYNH